MDFLGGYGSMWTGDDVRWLISKDFVERKNEESTILLRSPDDDIGDAMNKLGSRKADSLGFVGGRAST